MSDDTDICDDPGCAVCVDDGPGTAMWAALGVAAAQIANDVIRHGPTRRTVSDGESR